MSRFPLGARLRPEVRQELFPTDGRGEPLPRRFGTFAMLAKMIQGGLPVREVPEDYWSVELRDEHAVATVSCPCGAQREVELAAYPVKCECERFFFYTGTSVLALNSPSP